MLQLPVAARQLSLRIHQPVVHLLDHIVFTAEKPVDMILRPFPVFRIRILELQKIPTAAHLRQNHQISLPVGMNDCRQGQFLL